MISSICAADSCPALKVAAATAAEIKVFLINWCVIATLPVNIVGD
jgi:hypothetical protein